MVSTNDLKNGMVLDLAQDVEAGEDAVVLAEQAAERFDQPRGGQCGIFRTVEQQAVDEGEGPDAQAQVFEAGRAVVLGKGVDLQAHIAGDDLQVVADAVVQLERKGALVAEIVGHLLVAFGDGAGHAVEIGGEAADLVGRAAASAKHAWDSAFKRIPGR